MAGKRPTEIKLDTMDYRVRGEDGRYQKRPDRGLHRMASIFSLCVAAWMYFIGFHEWMPWYAFLAVVVLGFMAGAMLTISLRRLDW
jgi:hypothetical protein